MSIHDAQPADIYVDPHGRLWRVVSTCQEPTVTVREVDSPAPRTQTGGVSGLMWRGFRRIYRRGDE